ncbi:MAG: amidase [Pyrinomonadaceae bacterium]
MADLNGQSATQLAELIRHRKISPVEVIEACLKRIDEVNPRLNAIVTIPSDVVDQAKRSEATLMRGEAVGPLHGLPVTIKDTIETAGIRTTSGSVMRAEFIPEQDAAAVGRLKAAGAIILAKTNAAEMAMDYTADNPVFGRTNNPHDLSLTPGGSSGGESAAISSAMSVCGLGSDLAGSIRIPAHFCGIAGLKPTVRRVPGSGQFPAAIGPYSLGAVIGPMARTVDDLHLLLKVLTVTGKSVPSREDTTAITDGMRGCRVAWYSDDGVAPITAETSSALEVAAAILSDGGLVVERATPPGAERGHDLWLKMFSRASVAQLREVYTGHDDRVGEFVRWRLATADDAMTASLDDYIAAWWERDRLRIRLLEWMEDFALILAPVGATSAYPHDTHKVILGDKSLSTFRAFSYSQTFNVFDLPAVTIPTYHTKSGLPVGIQIVGRPFEEEMVLAAASIVERALGGWKAPPHLPH